VAAHGRLPARERDGRAALRGQELSAVIAGGHKETDLHRVDGNPNPRPSRSKTKELICEPARVREREEMATWKLVVAEVQAFLCDAALELDR
jgi:hypothetical protein